VKDLRRKLIPTCRWELNLEEFKEGNKDGTNLLITNM
jgi:hypothetical protein